MILLFLFISKIVLSSNLKCKKGFLNAYSIDGQETARFEKMFVCPEIKFSCCSPFDELKFHKNWFHYYSPKLDISQKKAEAMFNKLSKAVIFFQNFDQEKYLNNIEEDKKQEIEKLLKAIQNIEFDGELRPAKNELKHFYQNEKDLKIGFFCAMCDYSNHEYLLETQKSIFLQNSFCQLIMSYHEKYIQIINKLLNPILIMSYKIMHTYNTDYHFDKEDHFIHQINQSYQQVMKCFPDKPHPFNMENCKELCQNYSITSLSDPLFGNMKFYSHYFEIFKKFEHWLINLKEEFDIQQQNKEEEELEQERILSEVDRTRKKLVYKIKNLKKKLRYFQNNLKKKQKSKRIKRRKLYRVYETKKFLKKYKNQLRNWNREHLIHLNSKWDMNLETMKKIRRLDEASFTYDENGNMNCTNCEDAKNSTDSKKIIKSQFVENSTDISDSIFIYLSNNVSDSEYIKNSTNIDKSKRIVNSSDISQSQVVINSTNSSLLQNCTDVHDSKNCTNCHNCTLCFNCVNCENAFNVTNGHFILNVTNSTMVKNVTNGTFLQNVTDSVNVTYVLNSKNMTNASDIDGAFDNYNCSGFKCKIPRIEDNKIFDMIEKRIAHHTEKIVDRLYKIYRVGDINSYKKNKTKFDKHIFKSNNAIYDIDKFNYYFDQDGMKMSYELSSYFIEDPTEIKQEIVKIMMNSRDNNGVKNVEEFPPDVYDDKLVDEVKELGGIEFVYRFQNDINKRPLSFDFIQKINQPNIQEVDKNIEDNFIQTDEDSPDLDTGE